MMYKSTFLKWVFFSFAPLVFLSLLLAGCDEPAGKGSFSSADVFDRGDNAFDGVAGAATDEADDSSEDAGETRELVEPDVFRLDGNILYILNQYRGLTLVDLDTHEIIARAGTKGYPKDLYLSGGRAYVLTDNAYNHRVDGNTVYVDIQSKLYVVDVAVPEQASIIKEIDLEGGLVDSRLVGDVLYAVSAEFQWSWEPMGGSDDAAVSSEGSATASSPVATKSQTSESWLTSINVADPQNVYEVDSLSFAGYGDIVHATSASIYVAASEWFSDSSTITCVDISDPAGLIVPGGQVDVRGYISDRYKMDEYQGVLRVVSSTGWWNADVCVTTVDVTDLSAPALIAEVTIEEAAGETLFATRFDGPRAYVVTYLMQDPLFVLDLSDPAHPEVAGMLEVPGWSTHIETFGDRLIALGVDDTDGRRVCVSIFDVSDPAAPALADRVSFGENWAWSDAYNDVKAFTVMSDKIVVPFNSWSESGYANRLQFIGYTPDTLALGGSIDIEGSPLRTIEYGGECNSITTEQLIAVDVSDLNNPVVTHTTTLAEYVVDCHELSNGARAEVIFMRGNQTAKIRTLSQEGNVLGEVSFPISDIMNVFKYGDGILVVGTVTEPEFAMKALRISCSDPETPEVIMDITMDVRPWWMYWYYEYERGPVPLTDKACWMPMYSDDESVFLLGDILAVRCSADEYDVVSGAQEASQGVALVDLANEGVWKSVGLGYGNIISVDAADKNLYIGTKETASSDLAGRPYCEFYIREFDPVSLKTGPAANVPGTFADYNPVSNVLVLQDWQYNRDWDTTQYIRTVSWDGGETAKLIASYSPGSGFGNIMADAGYLFYSYYGYYGEMSKIGALRIASSGGISAIGELNATDMWMTILNAHEGSVYVVIHGSVIAEYDFGAETPVLKQSVDIVSAPINLTFGEQAAYASMGYAGVSVIDYVE